MERDVAGNVIQSNTNAGPGSFTLHSSLTNRHQPLLWKWCENETMQAHIITDSTLTWLCSQSTSSVGFASWLATPTLRCCSKIRASFSSMDVKEPSFLATFSLVTTENQITGTCLPGTPRTLRRYSLNSLKKLHSDLQNCLQDWVSSYQNLSHPQFPKEKNTHNYSMEQSTKLNPITGSSEPNASHMFSPDMWNLVVASMGARHHNHTIFYHFNFLILFPYHILYSDFQCQRGWAPNHDLGTSIPAFQALISKQRSLGIS